MLRGAAATANYSSSTGGATGSLSLLRLLCALLALEASFSLTNDAETNYTEISIDEALMAATEPTNKSGRMNSPGILRVQIDMLFPEEEWYTMIGEHDSHGNETRRKRRKAYKNEALRWPNGQVPYSVDATFGGSDMQAFDEAIEVFDKYTCIRFRPMRHADDRDFLRIVSDYRCASFVGRQGGPQYLSLPRGCRTKRIILHELTHAIGFIHEHSRSDRDDYVTVFMENVDQQYKSDFDKVTWNFMDAAEIPYDYKSVMHYGETVGAIRGKTAIKTKNDSYQHIIGKVSTLSFRDVKLINMVYRCSEHRKCRRKVCPGEGFVGQDCQCWCPSGYDSIPAVLCPGCLDFNMYCPYFKKLGLCNKSLYHDYLLDVCPKSCGSCPSGSA